MKKVFSTILAIIYLSTSMGATVHLHYCMGQLFSWGLADQEKKDCGHCGMPKSSTDNHCMAIKGGCCKDTQTVVKLDKDQKTSESIYNFTTYSLDALVSKFVNLPNRFVSSFAVVLPTTNAPPDFYKLPVFIRNHNFRI